MEMGSTSKIFTITEKSLKKNILYIYVTYTIFFISNLRFWSELKLLNLLLNFPNLWNWNEQINTYIAQNNPEKKSQNHLSRCDNGKCDNEQLYYVFIIIAYF